MTSKSDQSKKHVAERVSKDGMNVSPPAPINVRPATPPPSPPKASNKDR
jgi:hypothetical protein